MAVRNDHSASFAGSTAKGRLMIFGRPTLMWPGAPTPEEYYKSKGFSDVHTLDFSDYEGATFVHDLNNPETPKDLLGKYDAVAMGGTMEHVFNIGNVLKCAADLLAVGGIVMCSGPANNWLDHGFYQICPTLKFDFFQMNRFDLGRSLITLYQPQQGPFRRIIPVYPKETHEFNCIPARVSHMLFATKTEASTSDIVPVQGLYREKIKAERIKWRFTPIVPYDFDRKVVPAPLRRFPLSKPVLKDGCWAFRFNEEGCLPSLPSRPFRSKALVYENGTLLSWVVSHIDMVPEKNGSYVHAGGYIYLSTSDGSDPTTNGNVYSVAFPQPFVNLDPYADDPKFTRDANELVSEVA